MDNRYAQAAAVASTQFGAIMIEQLERLDIDGSLRFQWVKTWPHPQDRDPHVRAGRCPGDMAARRLGGDGRRRGVRWPGPAGDQPRENNCSTRSSMPVEPVAWRDCPRRHRL